MTMKTKKILKTLFAVAVGVIMGFIVCYGLMTFFPSQVAQTINTIQKEVTVNDNGISDGIEEIYDATVTVQNYQLNNLYSIGSGFVYDEEGYIITNHHVVDGATEVKVVLSNEEVVDAELIGSDEYADIAVIKIDKSKVLDVAKIGSSKDTKLGDTVFAIGSPVSAEYSGTVTRGILSGKDRMVSVSISSSTSSDYIMNVMQTDAAINPGNSGGPLCNVSGEVIGVNNMKIVESSIEGIGFAIPIEDAIEWANKITNGEEIKRAYLGIQMTDFSSVSAYSLWREGIQIDSSITSGVIVLDAIDGDPAQKAGLEKGDVIIKIGENKVSTVAELRYYLYKNNPGTEVEVIAIRDGKEKKFNVTLGEN